MTGYLPVGFEFGAELTFPEPEGTSSGLLNASAQTFGICFTLFYSELFYSYGDVPANVAMAVMLIVGTLITAATGSDLRRQNAQVVSASNRGSVAASGGAGGGGGVDNSVAVNP